MDTSQFGIFEVEPSSQIHFLIDLLLDEWGPGEAGRHLIEAFRKTDSTVFLADVFVERGRELGVFIPSSSKSEPRVSQLDFGALGEVLLERIQTATNEKTLDNAPFYFNVVRSWSHLCGPESPRRWLERGMKEDAAFMAQVCLGLVARTTGTLEARYSMEGALEEDLYDLTLLNEISRAHLESSTLSRDERNLISAVHQGSTRMLGAGQACGSA